MLLRPIEASLRTATNEPLSTRRERNVADGDAAFAKGVDMRNSIVLLGTLALLAACSRDRGPETGSTTTTGAGTAASDLKPATVEEVRIAILDHNPSGSDALSSVGISSESGVITLHGQVPDEESRQNMVNRVKRMPSVKSVKDELQVAPRTTGADDMSKLQGSTQASAKTKQTDAIHAALIKDKAAPAAVLGHLMITDDGTTISLSGSVPDDKTHDALLKSAQKAAGTEHVQDNLKVEAR